MAGNVNNSHENYERREKTKISSEKNFGFTFSAVFLILAVGPVFFGHPFRPWALGVSLAFFSLALGRPFWLRLPNRLWAQLGLLLNKIVSPLVLALLFFAAFLPTGLLLKLAGKDILSLKLDKNRRSYWINSDADSTSMRDQF